MFHRFLRPIQPPSRRAYSLFSKPPGGRFFNSSKPPKVVPPASAKSATRVETGTASGDAQQPQQQQQQQRQGSAPLPDDPSATPSGSSSQLSTPPQPVPSLSSGPTALASHPLLSAPDLRLHQFFSQHRPLVLSQPPTALFNTPPTLDLDPAPPRTHTATATGSHATTLEDPPETTPEADADTARLLARTQAMNAVSSAVSWEATLRRLGLNPIEDAALEGPSVELDSTKRKRRAKMKKHKCVNLV